MRKNRKSQRILVFTGWCFALAYLPACSGPTEKQPETVKKTELPEKADSLENKAKDGTIVESDTVSAQ